MDEEQVRKIIRDELSSLLGIDRYIFNLHLQILDARNIQLGRENGTMLGTASDQKLAFYGVTPIIQPATVADPTGGLVVDTEARGTINTIIDRLQALGLLST